MSFEEAAAQMDPRALRSRLGVVPSLTVGDEAPPEALGAAALAPVVALPVHQPPPSLEHIYEREHLGLFRFIKGVVRDQEQAEDILQESFLRLVAALRGGVAPENAHAWLYRVASNLAISRGRRARTMLRHLPELAAIRNVASPERHVLAAERDEALRRALDSLPLEMRAAVVLASSGFTAREIGATLGKSEGAVRMLVSRGRLRVRRLIDSADIERTTEAS
jgi:RNA polymerase sigma-70 factor (ECF subfamily)